MSGLPPKLKKEVKKLELQEELNHFSRIMGLDTIIAGSQLLPFMNDAAFKACKDFARFMWLVFERRNQKTNFGYKLKTFQGIVETNIQNPVSLISQNKENNFSVLLFAGTNLSKDQENDFQKVTVVLSKFLSTYSLEMAIGLLDYFLFLTKTDLKLGLISAQEISNKQGTSEIKIIGTSGFSLALTTNTTTFKNAIANKTSFDDKTNQPLGSKNAVVVFQKTFSLPSKASAVFLFSSDSTLSKLNNKRLQRVANQKDKKGKIILANNLKNFLQETKENDLMGIVKCGNKSISKDLTSVPLELKDVALSIPNDLVNAKKIVIESAHLHADRESSQTQLNTTLLRNELVMKLQNSGFMGEIEDILMIDDYHVVNRLDYKKYLSELKLNNFTPDFVILESSPVVRAIAIEVLIKLFKTTPNKLEVKGGNLYLKINQNKVIELVEGLGEKDTIGCVLFDAAFSLFKKDIKSATTLFKEVAEADLIDKTDSDLLKFYLKEKDPVKRNEFYGKLNVTLPTLNDLKKSVKTPFLNVLENVSGVEVVNVHEIFYKPQQAKVNALLSMINTKSITSAYINPQANDVLIECSALFG